MTHPSITDEMVERGARAMKPNHFAIYDAGFPAMNFVEQTRFLNAEKVVKRARKDARAAIEAALSGKEE